MLPSDEYIAKSKLMIYISIYIYVTMTVWTVFPESTPMTKGGDDAEAPFVAESGGAYIRVSYRIRAAEAESRRRQR
jgi:hypothetical protein